MSSNSVLLCGLDVDPVSRRNGWTCGGLAIFVLLAAYLVPSITQADVYIYIDKKGAVHYANTRINSNYKLAARGYSCGKDFPCGGRSKKIVSNYKAASGRRRQYAKLVNDVSREYRLNPALIHAVITVESAYDAKAVSHAGAMGLMQLMPGTAKRYGVDDPHDPKQNVSGGVRYLRDLLKQFRSLSLALAAYNAGEGAVLKYGKRVPPYPETRKYVRDVLRYYKLYRARS